MTFNLMAISASLIAGLATGIGALPIFFKKEVSKDMLDIGLGFSAGIMLVASFVSLILPGIEQAAKIYHNDFAILAVMIGLICGYLSIIVIHNCTPHEHFIKADDVAHNKKFKKMTLILLAIALHNIPEGLAVGVGFSTGESSQGLALALAIAIQNMPEGLVVAVGLLSAGSSKKKAFWLALLSGMIEPVAAFFGYIFAKISSLSLPITLGFAGGAMLFVICQEIFPELFRQGNEKKATFGVISGVILMLMIDFNL